MITFATTKSNSEENAAPRFVYSAVVCSPQKRNHPSACSSSVCIQRKSATRLTFVQIPIPVSIATFTAKDGSATSRSLKPGNLRSGPKEEDASCK